MGVRDEISRRRLLAGTGATAVAASAVLAGPALAAAPPAVRRREGTYGWVGTWGAAAAFGVPNTGGGYPNTTIRSALHASIGGDAVRVRLSNAFGLEPVDLSHVTVALAAGPNDPNAVPGTLRELTFGGLSGITIPVGADAFSDPAALAVPTGGDLLVTTFVPTPSGPVTYHPYAGQTSFYTNDGDHASDVSGAAFDRTTQVWHYVDEVDVLATSLGAVVAYGDSITDGVGSTWDANHRWPDHLARRIATLPAGQRFGVVNAGVSGNRLLLDGGDFGVNALARIDRDVLAKTSARTMIMLLGVNDIQQSPHQYDPNQIVMGLRQAVSQARARGLRVMGATITPFQGFSAWNPTLEGVRAAVNHWIRTGGGYDAVVDFDAAIRDPANPLAMLPAYDSGDHLHPRDAGYAAMAGAVRLDRL